VEKQFFLLLIHRNNIVDLVCFCVEYVLVYSQLSVYYSFKEL